MVLEYEKTFLRGGDLKDLTGPEAMFVKAHLVPRLESEGYDHWLGVLAGIGPYLEIPEAVAATTVVG